MIARIIVGILGTLLGVSLIIKNDAYVRFLGMNAWAEVKLGSGGTRTFYKLIGLIIIFISWIYAFNWLNNLLTFILGGLIPNN